MNPWKDWINNLVREGDFPLEFQLALRAVAQRCYGGTSVGWYSAEDLASDFLSIVLTRRGAAIESEKGVERRMMITLMQRIDPVAKQIWDVLSTAIRTLQRQEKVRRLHEPADKPNHNAAIWTSASKENDTAKFDAVQFEIAAASDESIRTLFRGPWKSEHGKRRERILSPKNAETLLEALLACANGPIPFGNLFDEARKRVFAYQREDVESGKEIKDSGMLNPSEQFLVAHESSRITDAVWSKIEDDERLRNALCGYLLPKWRSTTEHPRITQQTANVADEWVTKVKTLIANEFRPELFESPNREGQLTRSIARNIFDVFEQKCAEKSGD
jgi:hypothetical protein